jgi:hypothetical protein
MPAKFLAPGVEPPTPLLRRGQIIRWLGISPCEFDKVVGYGLLPYVSYRKEGHRYFRKSDVVNVFLRAFKEGD